MVRHISLVTCLAGAAVLAPVRSSAQWKTPWTYTGPRGASHWAALDPAYALCATGRAQSPIDITQTATVDLPPLRFAFHPGPLEYLIDNGATIRVNYHAPGSGDVLAVGRERYQLTQFHFHLPSEEQVQGKAAPMEAHLMFQAANGAAAGVAVFIVPGRANPMVETLWRHMPRVVGKEENVPGATVDPVDLLPRDLGYYVYVGSVTAPPCTENVRWFVLKAPIELSPAQIAAFAKRYPNDARPVMPLNGRVVQSSR